MAPKGRKKQIGLRREDAARDRMKDFGFEKRVINESIKQVLEVYGEDQWFLIEDANYAALLSICLEKQKEQEETAQEEQEEEKEADALSITNEAVMDSSPPAFQFVEASVDFAHQSVGGAQSSHCGWLSSEEETDPEDSDEMIQLTPEPLCEELEELLREVYGQKKMKYN
ncbi:WIYLD domain [Arabidopsis suecica]|uniref:WIYLD domain n=1 Tax=Arabidopsis suecica TaxID=45249 RepID=A0A8T2CPT5_ARASU|nr:WIYLD domain [Arabidopsis suecica]